MDKEATLTTGHASHRYQIGADGVEVEETYGSDYEQEPFTRSMDDYVDNLFLPNDNNGAHGAST